MTALLLLAALAAPLAPRAAEPAAEPVVRVQDGVVTMHVVDMPLEDAIQRVAAATGAEIVGGVRAPHPVSIELDRVPLDEALHRLLGDQNFMLTFRDTGALKRLVLLGGPMPPEAATQIVKTGATTTTAPGPQTPLWMHPVRLPPGSPLVQQFNGAESANLQQLLDVAVRNDDSALRGEAVRVGMDAIESEPALRAQMLSSLQMVDDAALTTAVENLAHGRARELATLVIGSTKTPELRARVIGVLGQLSSNPAR
jgi:hypothetical protein